MPLPRLLAHLFLLGGVASVATALGAACSVPLKHYDFVGLGGGGAGGTGSGTGAGDIDGFDPGDGGVALDSGCASAVGKADLLPLDIYVMLDQSGSMGEPVAGGGTKWGAVTQALTTFVNQPGLDGVSIGIEYFGLGGNCGVFDLCSVDADCPVGCSKCVGADPAQGTKGFCNSATQGQDSCSAADYAQPEVEIAPLPGVGPAIVTSMSQHHPGSGTPTSAALQGAIDHGYAWAKAHPFHVTTVLLATDGQPSVCDTSIANIEQIAAAGAAKTPSVTTFVVGVGSSLAALNGIAHAGGSNKATIVDTTQDVAAQFLAALGTVRSTVACSYAIPAPTSGAGPVDYAAVNVQFAPAGGKPAVVIPEVTDKTHCPLQSGGWYYDDPQNPQQIVLCQATCAHLGAYGPGQVEVVLGCQSIVK